jgi:hypothetical protein
MKRTTIVLDSKGEKAAKQLSALWGCSGSEAIRRALVAQRDSLLGQSPARRAERRRLLLELFDQFDGTDAASEIARRKSEDEFF